MKNMAIDTLIDAKSKLSENAGVAIIALDDGLSYLQQNGVLLSHEQSSSFFGGAKDRFMISPISAVILNAAGLQISVRGAQLFTSVPPTIADIRSMAMAGIRTVNFMNDVEHPYRSDPKKLNEIFQLCAEHGIIINKIDDGKE